MWYIQTCAYQWRPRSSLRCVGVVAGIEVFACTSGGKDFPYDTTSLIVLLDYNNTFSDLFCLMASGASGSMSEE